jgi:hypothetical protein
VGGLACFVAFGAPHVRGQVENSGAIQTDEPANEDTPAAACVLTCVQSILEQRGEAILQQDAQPGLLTWPHLVTADELARLALLTDPDPAEWLEGMYQIQVTAAPVGAGAPKFEVEARILARQTTSLPVLRPSTWQRLESSGVLEQEVSAELAACSSPSDQMPQRPPSSSAAEQ